MDERICPECSQPFTPTREWQRFCTPVHRQHFERVMLARGKLREPFTSTAFRTRPRSAKERELRAYARQKVGELEAKFREEDRAAGRRPELVVAARKDTCWSVADLNMRAAWWPPGRQDGEVEGGSSSPMLVTSIGSADAGGSRGPRPVRRQGRSLMAARSAELPTRWRS